MTLESATIMAVDDTPANLKLLQEMLQGAGYRVLAFPRGTLALKAARRNPPDLVLLDITMPDMDGYEVCQSFKSDEALKHIPILFISALNEISDKVRAFRAGGVDFVTKPFQFEEVNARVQTHLALMRQQRELEERYQELKRLEEMRDGLVHMIVHDMRSPLTVILGSLDLAELEPQTVSGSESLDHARFASRRLMEMISTLLDMNRLESGQLRISPAAVDLDELISASISAAKPTLGGRVIQQSSKLADSEYQLDKELIERVLFNLLSNAIKYTSDSHGQIQVVAKDRPDGQLELAVIDNGPGIPPEFRERVFEKFSQVEKGSERRRHSSGLGLNFCKLVAEAHGGSIGFKEAEGGGSHFWICIPKAISS
jgi:two-component system sensor histidine kinase/response regulator